MLKPSIHFPYPAWGRWGVWADHINLGERRGTPCKGRHSIIRLTQKDNSFSPRWHTHTNKIWKAQKNFRSHLIIEFNLFFKLMLSQYTDRLIEFHKCKCPHISNTFSPGLYRIRKNYSLNLKSTASSSVVVHRLWGKLFESQRPLFIFELDKWMTFSSRLCTLHSISCSVRTMDNSVIIVFPLHFPVQGCSLEDQPANLVPGSW